MALSEPQREFARKAFEVGFGVVVAAAIALTTAKNERSVVDDALIGLLVIVATAFILEPIEEKRRMRELSDSVRRLSHSLTEVKTGINAVHGDFADQIDRYTLALRFTNKNLDKDEMPNAWERMLWSMRGDFDATSFVRPSDYALSYPDLGLAIQEAKVKVAKARVRRIFIVENEHEFRTIQTHMTNQVNAHITVSYVLLDEIVRAGINLDRYETLDFGLFDDSKSVFLWLLDNRSVAGGRIELNNDQYPLYRSLFERLCKLAHPWEPAQGLAA